MSDGERKVDGHAVEARASAHLGGAGLRCGALVTVCLPAGPCLYACRLSALKSPLSFMHPVPEHFMACVVNGVFPLCFLTDYSWVFYKCLKPASLRSPFMALLRDGCGWRGHQEARPPPSACSQGGCGARLHHDGRLLPQPLGGKLGGGWLRPLQRVGFGGSLSAMLRAFSLWLLEPRRVPPPSASCPCPAVFSCGQWAGPWECRSGLQRDVCSWLNAPPFLVCWVPCENQEHWWVSSDGL